MARQGRRRGGNRPATPGQGDLFDQPSPRLSSAPPGGRAEYDVRSLSDDKLLARLDRAGSSEAVALLREISERGLTAGVPVLHRLWKRFSGFGVRAPLPEQLAVLCALARLNTDSACQSLREVLLSPSLPSGLQAPALEAAVDAKLVLPGASIAGFLEDPDARVRASAFALAFRAGLTGDRVRTGLLDPDGAVRRAAAVTLGRQGDRAARDFLLDALRNEPSADVIDAIAGIPDDEIVVELARCAAAQPIFRAEILSVLTEMDDPVSARVAQRLTLNGD